MELLGARQDVAFVVEKFEVSEHRALLDPNHRPTECAAVINEPYRPPPGWSLLLHSEEGGANPFLLFS
jgi:hypothetical protein